ncbi:MAG: DUF3152 domain-containing protein [Actinomycetota bacterium]|nr:DUF3152 domain-containing protein [Actinomycetota bacterium]
MSLTRRWRVLLAATAMLAACGDTRRPQTVTTTRSSTTAPLTSVAPPPAPAGVTPASAIVEVAYRVEARTTDRATSGFADAVDATLADARGWSRAGFRFVRHRHAPFLIVLAEGEEVDRLCLPYETYGEYSCQNGPVVALNAERWRSATPKWTGDLAGFRQMLINHEVGHLLGQRHPERHCPRPGRLAAVMAQQSTELNGCLPNPWPLKGEIEVAARHDQPLAPPFSR